MRGAYDTITIWNKARKEGKDVWYRHVIHNCSWELKAVRAASGQTASLASTTAVIITENPQYKPVKEWAVADKEAFFTLQTGDLMALGEQAVEITGVAPYRESDVRQSLAPNVCMLRIVQDNTAGYKLGRHYYVEGT